MPRDILVGTTVPQHIVQRGYDRGPCFYADEDYSYYLECLSAAARDHACRVHAYVLLPDHVHLLGTARTRLGFTGMMQTVRDRYAQYVKQSYRRAAPLWAGRHQASFIQPDRTLIECYRYVELHPVRSGLARHPANYRWSSHMHHALGVADRIITEHGQYQRLGVTPSDRYQAWRELMREPLRPQVIDAIRRATAAEGILGDESFVQQVTTALRRRITLPRRELGLLATIAAKALKRPEESR